MEHHAARKNFLERLQSADEETKRRLVIVLSACVMVLIVFLWLKYFNNFIIHANEPVAPAAEQGTAWWRPFTQGGASLFRTFAKSIEALGDFVGGPRTYIIEPNP